MEDLIPGSRRMSSSSLNHAEVSVTSHPFASCPLRVPRVEGTGWGWVDRLGRARTSWRNTPAHTGTSWIVSLYLRELQQMTV